MLNWLKKRAKERNTYTGLSLLGLAVASLAKAPEIVPVAQAIGASADQLATGGLVGAAMAVFTGFMNVAQEERK